MSKTQLLESKIQLLGGKNPAIEDENDGINDGVNYISIDDNEGYNLIVYLIVIVAYITYFAVFYGIFKIGF